MSQTKKIVITNHTDKFVEWYHILTEHGYTKDDVIIYDRDDERFNGVNLDPARFDQYGTVIKSPNVGYGIYDCGRYIYDNYDNLPDFMIFIKCNLLQNHYTTRKRFEYALHSNFFVPIDADPVENFYRTPLFVNDCPYVEKVTDIICPNTKVYPRIKNFEEFIRDLFVMERIPDYLLFAPGGNYVVPKQNMLKYSKNFYKKMMVYTDYHHSDVQEAHWFERILTMAWQGCLEENFSHIV